LDACLSEIEQAGEICVDTYKNGGKILLCGNGGSAADCQHIAAELVGRFKTERRGLPAIALTTDTSIITAITNDYWYDYLFARQVEALGNEGDLLFGLSTSGNSVNVVRALEFAGSAGMKTIALTGRDGGKIRDLADVAILVPAQDPDRIQESHIMIGHILCDIIERKIFHEQEKSSFS
jgi:D-sedoheptulose 7-phosphate isomerase